MPSEEKFSVSYSVANSQAEIPKPKSLREILNCPLLFLAFREYCESEMAIENVRFWEEVEAYKKLPEEHRTERFLEIYQKYFDPDSVFELNASTDERRRLDHFKETLSSSPPPILPKDVFDRIQRRVYAELSTDVFYRFLSSEYYARYLDDREDPDGSKRRRTKLEYFFGVELKGSLHRIDLIPLKKKRVIAVQRN